MHPLSMTQKQPCMCCSQHAASCQPLVFASQHDSTHLCSAVMCIANAQLHLCNCICVCLQKPCWPVVQLVVCISGPTSGVLLFTYAGETGAPTTTRRHYSNTKEQHVQVTCTYKKPTTTHLSKHKPALVRECDNPTLCMLAGPE